MKIKTLAFAIFTLTSTQAYAEDAGGSIWGSLLGAAVNVASQRAGVPVDSAAAQQAAAIAQAAAVANASIGSDAKSIQANLGVALATQAAANGQTLTPAQQQALNRAGSKR